MLSGLCGDTVGIVFSFLEPVGQASLRSCSSQFVQWFDTAVQSELFVAMAGSNTVICSAEPIPSCRWWPAGRQAPRGSSANTERAEAQGTAEGMTGSENDSTGSPFGTLLVNLSLVLKNESVLPDRFLFQCSFQSIVFHPPTQTPFYEIGDNFAASSPSLTHINFNCFDSVHTIGNGFLSFSRALEHVDLTGLESVTHIGTGFLLHCWGIQELSLYPLRNVVAVGNNSFLAFCRGLVRVDFAGMSKLNELGKFCLMGCDSLQSVDLSPLSALTSIGMCSLHRCKELTTVNFCSLSRVKTVGIGFLTGCPKLRVSEKDCEGCSDTLFSAVRAGILETAF